MKTISTLLALVLACCWSLAAYSSPGLKNIPLNCLITQNGLKKADIALRLYEDDRLLDTVVSNKDGMLKLFLAPNATYTLEVASRGYFRKKIQINTAGCRATPEQGVILQLTLTPDYSRVVDYDRQLDHPFGLFHVRKDKKRFTYNKRHARKMRRLELIALRAYYRHRKARPEF
ncbi:MAG: hypothetical protein AAGB22_11040 [Bacteroidota bacterium]